MVNNITHDESAPKQAISFCFKLVTKHIQHLKANGKFIFNFSVNIYVDWIFGVKALYVMP